MLPLLLLLAPLRAYEPGEPRYLPGPDELFWFVQLSDTHVGEDLGYGTQDADNLSWAMDEAVPVIGPAFVVNTGDLVDASNGYFVPTQQYQEEWDEYRELLAGQDVTFYHDFCGNHDTYSDPGATYYLANSFEGQAFGTWHEAWSEGFPWGEYAFIGFQTSDTSGAAPGLDDPGVTEDELAFLSDALAAYEDARLAFVFSHHPLRYLESGADELMELLGGYGVSAWINGHVHSVQLEWLEGDVLSVTLASAGKSDGDNLGLYAVDGDGLAFRAVDIGQWPMVLVTAPLDAGLGGANPRAYRVSMNQLDNPVRALVFSPEAPERVWFTVDGVAWGELEQLDGPVWQGEWDCTVIEPGTHELEVIASTPSGTDSHAITVEVALTACDNGVDDDGNGYADYPEDGGCWGPSDDDESGWTPPEEDDTGILVHGEAHRGDEPDGDTGGARFQAIGSGRCGCSSAAPAGAALAWPLLLLGLGRLRRRPSQPQGPVAHSGPLAENRLSTAVRLAAPSGPAPP